MNNDSSKKPFVAILETGDNGVSSEVGKITRADFLKLATQFGRCVANLPIARKGDEIVFVLVNETSTAAAVVMAGVKATIKYCQTSAILEDGASEKIAELAWNIADNH